MAEPQVVIRTYAPARRWLILAVLGVVAVLGGYLLFEFGRSRAGFDNLAAIRQRAELREQLEQRDAAIRDLRRMAADFQTFRAAQDQERSEVSRTIGELQAQVARQSQELSFYKGIVVKDVNKADVAIQQLRVTASPAGADRYILRLMLVQPARPDGTVTGTVAVTVEGQQGGAAAKLDTAALTAGKNREIGYSFRYFENMEPEIVFRPERLTVEVRSSRRGVEPVVQTILWSVETG
jgi:type II secretory pathway pseudopilin PulG